MAKNKKDINAPSVQRSEWHGNGEEEKEEMIVRKY